MSDAMRNLQETLNHLEAMGVTGCFASLIASPYDLPETGTCSETGFAADATLNDEGLV